MRWLHTYPNLHAARCNLLERGKMISHGNRVTMFVFEIAKKRHGTRDYDRIRCPEPSSAEYSADAGRRTNDLNG